MQKASPKKIIRKPQKQNRPGTKAALPFMKANSCIINTASVTGYRGRESLMDYASTKGAIISFTRSLSSNLVDKGIRVNAVAPGPIWTPLIAATFDAKKVAQHGSDVPMKRAGESVEVAHCNLFLASEDGSYFTGQYYTPMEEKSLMDNYGS